jgi:hypothetical protein
LDDADVVCRQLGYSQAYTYYGNAYYGEGADPILLDGLQCRGTELTLLQCTSNRVTIHDCSHSEDVSVRCTGSPSGVCVNGDIRLAGSSSNSSGTVEVCINNTWGTVCNDDWDETDAGVVCKMLNFRGYSAVDDTDGVGSGGSMLISPLVYGDVACRGFESSLFSCQTNNNCTLINESAAIKCSNYSTCPYGAIRLVNGSNQYEGRVEICINSVWGTICDDSFWDEFSAQVVCHQLGYPTSNAVAYHNAYFGPGTGPILLDDVFCLGNEKSILECDSNINPFSLINSYLHNCVHSEDAGVACLSHESSSIITAATSTPTPAIIINSSTIAIGVTSGIAVISLFFCAFFIVIIAAYILNKKYKLRRARSHSARVPCPSVSYHRTINPTTSATIEVINTDYNSSMNPLAIYFTNASNHLPYYNQQSLTHETQMLQSQKSNEYDQMKPPTFNYPNFPPTYPAVLPNDYSQPGENFPSCESGNMKPPSYEMVFNN